MKNLRLKGLIFSIPLGISLLFSPIVKNSSSGEIISNYETSEQKTNMFNYFNDQNDEINQEILNEIREKDRKGEYLNLKDMKILAENCSQKTLEDAALCFFSSIYALNENSLKKILLPGTKKENIKEYIGEYNEVEFRVKPARWKNKEFFGKMNHYMFETRNGKGGGGTTFVWFVERNGKWYCDLNYSIENYPRGKEDLLKYNLFVQKEFAEKIGVKKVDENKSDWIRVPKEIYEQMLKK